MSFGCPSDCVTDTGDIANVPVVFRYYTETHACAAVCRSFSTSTQTITFAEDWDSLNAEEWKGMTVGQLWDHLPFIKLHHQVEWHAVQSVEDVLQREKIQFPPFIRQMSRVGQDGEISDEDNDDEWIKRCRSSVIEGGVMHFKNQAAELGGSESMTKAVHSYSKFRAQREAANSEGSRDRLRWVQLGHLCSFVVQLTSTMENLRKICMVVSTHQSWGRLEGFLKGGTDTGHFDGSMLVQSTKDETMDWSLMQDLVQQASSAALGREDSAAGNGEDMVELMGCLSELREFATHGANSTGPCRTVGLSKDVVIQLVAGESEVKQEKSPGTAAPKVTSEQAELLFLRAVTAASVHRRKALTLQQNTPDPGQEWLVEQGDLMKSAVDWMGLAYPNLPDRDKLESWKKFSDRLNTWANQ